ncbi:AAA family ATPase [Catellatospora tritici]|uniref:AAA family ATPase n=1 Tax=Catellatospora tritici TaxID=2851566 RepID=UPI001C2CFDC4|nr:SMC family ATPase [Catellatospora tritici]MBV1851586.1 SMC family ATPase [Catellatospora tritici]
MRPLRLDLRGFTVFREPTTVDLTDCDFFALVGPTGSGKSTLLDAICFALYGTAPRWGGGKSVAHALAPSASEAAVRLIFEAGGTRYAATRVVRRDGKGRVATRAAGLQALSPGFDASTLDGDDLLDELGEALAGTPAELDHAVADVVGLPYDQFTKCVVLPQGDFAAFLHARPAERQEILVRLLGLDVYEKVRERAAALVTEANGKLAATEPVLAELTAAASDEALAAAEQRVDAARRLAADVEAALPALAQAQREVELVAEATTAAERRLTVLTSVVAPADAATLAGAAKSAATAAADAAVAAGTAEEAEDKLRTQLDDAPDPTVLRSLLEAHVQAGQLSTKLAELDATALQAREVHEAALAAQRGATEREQSAQDGLDRAQQAMLVAQTADRAAWLRRDLVAGHECPVCTQPVATVPAMPDQPAMNAAKKVVAEAEQALTTARNGRAELDRRVLEAAKRLDQATVRREELARRAAEVARLLEGAAPVPTLRADLASVEALRGELAEARGRLREAREAQRAAAARAQQATERMAAAWRHFDGVRDTVAALTPPPADRDDLAAAWSALAGWAREQATAAQAERDGERARLSAARAQAASAQSVLDELFTAAGLPVPRPGAHQRDAAVAVERAVSGHDVLLERRAQAEALRAQRAAVEADRQVATALANHLRANNFEAWLLQEALDALVDGASAILRELSSGQYDLIHDDREFYVVDHHDAGLRRTVRTLSGGETFQASLALALALADQLGGLSPTASLESIMLDEGFGTLDASTLDTVAATLENLAASGDRMVGVVTHVQALAERIPVRFEITKDARTARVERIG